jgi:hypothetical protein
MPTRRCTSSRETGRCIAARGHGAELACCGGAVAYTRT